MQVAILQAQLMQAKAQLACGSAHSPVSHHHQWSSNNSIGSLLRQDTTCGFPAGALSPELMASFRDDVAMQQHCAKADAGDLQYLAQAMMRSGTK
jgi:LOB domain-containing protein 16